ATVSSSLKVLCEADRGLFRKSVTREYVEGLGWRSTMQLVPRANSVMGLLKAAATYTPERPARERSDRPRCPDPPFADVAKRWTLVCTECGQLLPPQPEV